MADDFVHRMKTTISEAEYVSESVLHLIENELKRNPSVDLWILRGEAIQLSEGHSYDPADAEVSYRKALALDPESSDAYESLAYFTFAVKADARGSLPLFRRAIALGAG